MNRPPQPHRPATSRTKRVIFASLIASIVWLTIDTGIYVALTVIGSQRQLFYEPRPLTDAQAEGFLKKRFHQRWGWDIPADEKGTLGERARTEIAGVATGPPVMIKSFGDSFCYGVGVEIDQTFQHFVERETGWACLNYGVGAFGTDQALLKYLDTPLPSRYTVLTILDENVGRCMTVWWNFYQHVGFSGTKPRFELRGDEVVLVDNPADTPALVRRLTEPGFIDTLRPHDYWQGYYRGIGAPPRLRWPATATVLPHASFFVRYSLALAGDRLAPSYDRAVELKKVNHLYEPGSPALVILQHIVSRFQDTAAERGETPIVLLFPQRESMDLYAKYSRKPYQALTDIVAQTGQPFLDFADVFLGEDTAGYYQPDDWHFSVKGNQRVAAALVELVRDLEQAQALQVP